jgi:predicted ATPase
MTVHHLSRDQIERLAEQVAGVKALPDEIIQQLIEKTDGVPLYVEEMTKSILESGVLKEANSHYELSGSISSLSIPATLQDSLMARLDRLMTAKVVAQLGATMGRQFSYELLHAVAQIDEPTLQREPGRLVDAELVYQRGIIPQAIYIFKHALIQDTAYESLLRNTRQGYHRRIAEVLEGRFPETAENQPELLAHHFTEAGFTEKAVGYWQQAGEKSVQRSAHQEAIAHLTQGLDLLTTLPGTPTHLQQELDFQVAFGLALRLTKGHGAPEVERAYDRAKELCELVGNTPQLFPVLRGLIVYAQTRGNLQQAHELGEQLLYLAESHPTPEHRMLAHYQMGQILFYRGEPAPASTHHLQTLSMYNPQSHRDLVVRYGMDFGVGAHGFLSWELWQLGYPDQAMQHSEEAHLLAQNLSHPYALTFARVSAAFLYHFRRGALATHEQAEATIALATEQGFMFWLSVGTILHGWALAMQGQEAVGIVEMRKGIAAELATGSKAYQAYFLGLLAQTYGKVGHFKERLGLLAEGLAMMDTTELSFCGAELHRLRGQLLLQQSLDNQPEAESCFQQAISIAQNQSAKSWELRAATSLAKLWQQQGKRQEAYDLLAPVYAWFTEGFDTLDLIEAKALLDELGDY